LRGFNGSSSFIGEIRDLLVLHIVQHEADELNGAAIEVRRASGKEKTKTGALKLRRGLPACCAVACLVASAGHGSASCRAGDGVSTSQLCGRARAERRHRCSLQSRRRPRCPYPSRWAAGSGEPRGAGAVSVVGENREVEARPKELRYRTSEGSLGWKQASVGRKLSQIDSNGGGGTFSI